MERHADLVYQMLHEKERDEGLCRDCRFLDGVMCRRYTMITNEWKTCKSFSRREKKEK